MREIPIFSETNLLHPLVDEVLATDAERMLSVIRKLAGATDAQVVAFDRAKGSVAPLIEATTGKVLPDHSRVVAGYSETMLLREDSRPRWIRDDLDGRVTTFVQHVCDEEDRMFLLVLRFEDLSHIARAKVTKLAPDLAILVESQVGVVGKLRRLEEYQLAATQALNYDDCGVIAVRADHSVIFANETAAAYLNGAGALRIRRGFIQPADQRHAIRFEAVLDDVIGSGQRDSAGRPQAAIMLLKRDGEERPMLVAITPMPDNARSVTRGRAAIIYVIQVERDRLHGAHALGELHGLSRVESRLLINLLGGATLVESAEEMRIKHGTARAYLKQIFAKLGVHRQSDLLIFMARYLKALRGNFDFRPL